MHTFKVAQITCSRAVMRNIKAVYITGFIMCISMGKHDESVCLALCAWRVSTILWSKYGHFTHTWNQNTFYTPSGIWPLGNVLLQWVFLPRIC